MGRPARKGGSLVVSMPTTLAAPVDRAQPVERPYSPSRASNDAIQAFTRAGVAATTAAPATSVPVA